MSTEPTPGELMRSLGDLKQTVTAQRTEVNERLDKMPTAALMAAEFTTLRTEMTAITYRLTKVENQAEALDARMDNEAAERTKQRRQIIVALTTSFLAPLAVALVLALLLGGN